MAAFMCQDPEAKAKATLDKPVGGPKDVASPSREEIYVGGCLEERKHNDDIMEEMSERPEQRSLKAMLGNRVSHICRSKSRHLNRQGGRCRRIVLLKLSL